MYRWQQYFWNFDLSLVFSYKVFWRPIDERMLDQNCSEFRCSGIIELNNFESSVLLPNHQSSTLVDGIVDSFFFFLHSFHSSLFILFSFFGVCFNFFGVIYHSYVQCQWCAMKCISFHLLMNPNQNKRQNQCIEFHGRLRSFVYWWVYSMV